MPEGACVPPHLTPREFVTLCARASDMKGDIAVDVEEALGRAGVGDDAREKRARTLSKGTLQRVGLAAALVHGPELLILDEPMDGLDPLARKQVRALLSEERRRGRGVLFSSHILSDVEELCDRVCVLREGRVAALGTRAEVLHGEETLEELFIKT